VTRASRLADIPEEERPRERLERLGAAALSDAELLAILLRTGRRGESALQRAQEVLGRAEGAQRLAALSVAQLVKVHGLGRVQSITVAAALELSRRAASKGEEKGRFSEPARVKRYLQGKYAHLTQERTGALYVDARNRLLRDVECYRGTLDRALVEPREILKGAILEDAAGVILYHNHPSGDPSPSPEDLDFTRRLKRAAEHVGVRLLDHVIVGREGSLSFKESGLF
jgi:DNA repair protein RadC